MTRIQHGRRWLTERPYIIALFITLTLILWMASGIMQAQEVPKKTAKENNVIPKVKVATLFAEQVSDVVELYGRTEPDRVTQLKAEISGKIKQVLAKRGSKVTKGQIIAKLEMNDLEAQLMRSKALLSQREIEYQGAKKLNADGYQGQVQVSSAAANLAAVKAEIKRLEIAISYTVIRAPFDGILNTRYVEEGDYVKSGDDIAMIADLDPLVVRAFVTEQQISQLSVGQSAEISLLNKTKLPGHLRYISSVADDSTNTFKIEVAIENSDLNLLAGISSEVAIVLNEVSAMKLSPALLALDEMGNIGVKTVNQNTVVFTPIDVVKSENDGIWLAGLGEQADVIILGQGFVRAGDTVDAIMSTEK
ncbi:efflux RND transporter periplasmic adaptor subunit [Colwellia sp. 1_MG-2023]|uniref:efflux RND transporter periplasmic adaptor subunit n=1 Tax=Colwellia sp. 1_MG-2023 TaxID=3062649 RepID=UPI0026E2A29D|nr:efflux RND transporter periplasmic adaptor subunit [Colwellia sp. 1_MG-2023]MDO6444761.1 efflux RND transporter periplasmic adaptor subunit [Colwellia sp. 1_MG-2023]